ncbi:MAG: tRNA dihydrouridine(20/20a) synthase DusA, partial [Gammaproteobacteria bacterium]|nr:tRNA dihydrouridine(20/20a) synthase DusA [Gammaproteobacteria bacterium]
ARKAILNGLSPKENREVPPLDYSRVFSIKEKFPELEIIINGGIKDLKIAKNFLNKVDGVMLGREAYQNPYILHEVDQEFYDECIKDKSRIEYLMDYLPYVEKELNQGTPLKHISRHLFGLFKGQRGGKKFRRYLSENSHRPNAGIDVLKNAISLLI